MTIYVPPTEQLMTEIVVRDIRRSAAFYRRLGFTLLRDGGDERVRRALFPFTPCAEASI